MPPVIGTRAGSSSGRSRSSISIAFLVAVNQFVPLLGERGLLPVRRFVSEVPFGASPSLFFFAPSDRAFRIAAWVGVLVSCIALSGFLQRRSALAAAAMWGALWILYLSFVNVGQTFYGVRLGIAPARGGILRDLPRRPERRPRHVIVNWIYRWTLFRLMFGAGLIKMRGDPCWRDLTCLDYYFETQPIPNALSWYCHHCRDRCCTAASWSIMSSS